MWNADRHGWSTVCLVARPYLVWRLLAASGWGQVLAQLAIRIGESWSWCWPAYGLGQVMRWLAAEPSWLLGLVLAHWWGDPGLVLVGCGVRGSRASVGLLMDRIMVHGVLG